MNEKRPIDPFTRTKVLELHEGEIMDRMKERELAAAESTYLDKLRLNLVVALGSPFRVKYDLVERGLAILHMIEKDKEKLHDVRWIYTYKDFWNSTQRELEKLDKVWKDLQTKRSSHEQLRAFTNIEIFIDFLSNLDLSNGKYTDNDDLLREFIEFLKDKEMFI